MRKDDLAQKEKEQVETQGEGSPQASQEGRAREAAEAKTGEAADWAELLAQAGPREVRPGDIVTGIVAAVTAEGVSVDLGAKLEGLIPRSEFATESELPRVDETIEVAVVKIDDEAGVIRLSKRRADYARLWKQLEEAARTGAHVDAMVIERVKGGLRVDVGVPGFVPASQVATADVRNLDRFVGQSLRLKVLEADPQTKKVVLSHRQAVEEERERRRAEAWARLEEGAIVEGKVRSLTSYGAFIDLGGVEGLLHISEIDWVRVDDPAEVLRVGQKVTVTILEMNPETGKIALSRRQILPDPWKEAARKLRPGQLVKARITRLVRTGAFALLREAGIEGFIPLSELSHRRINDPSEVVQPGQEVDLRINEIRVEARRMTLSLIGAEQEKERQEYQEYMRQQKAEPRTLGDRFGQVLRELVVEEEQVPAEATVPKEETAAEATASQTEDAAARHVAAANGSERSADLGSMPESETTEQPISVGEEATNPATAEDKASEPSEAGATAEAVASESET